MVPYTFHPVTLSCILFPCTLGHVGRNDYICIGSLRDWPPTAELEVVGNQPRTCLIVNKLLTYDTLSWWLFCHVDYLLYLYTDALVLNAPWQGRLESTRSSPPDDYTTKVRLYSDMAMRYRHKKRDRQNIVLLPLVLILEVEEYYSVISSSTSVIIRNSVRRNSNTVTPFLFSTST